MEEFLTAQFWLAVGQIIMIDILLGGDNAVVIALACRKLPPHQRFKGIIWGTAGAIILRVVLIFFALQLLQIPFLKIIGALLLVWIGIKLLIPENDDHGNIAASDKLWAAIKTIIVADFVMSLDNVIAIAGAAQGAAAEHHLALVVFGLVISIPIIVWGSQLVIKLMDRFPVIITLGAMLLGWIAGTMLIADQFLTANVLQDSWLDRSGAHVEVVGAIKYGCGIAGALLVLIVGKVLAGRRPKALQD
ncbi:TerC family protein [Comamonadaceae bacterium PP-2]